MERPELKRKVRRAGNTKVKESDGCRKEGGVSYVRCCSRIR